MIGPQEPDLIFESHSLHFFKSKVILWPCFTVTEYFTQDKDLRLDWLLIL